MRGTVVTTHRIKLRLVWIYVRLNVDVTHIVSHIVSHPSPVEVLGMGSNGRIFCMCRLELAVLAQGNVNNAGNMILRVKSSDKDKKKQMIQYFDTEI